MRCKVRARWCDALHSPASAACRDRAARVFCIQTHRSKPVTPLQLQPDLVAQVYDSVLDAICAGSLRPGERITQEALAARLGVSRQPVLQAFARLKREGFLADAGRKGVQVTPLDPRRLEQVYQVRAELDALAAGLAAALPPAAREAAVRAGRAAIESGRAALAGGDLARLIDADMAFHLWLYRASGNPLIEPTLALHWQHIRRYMGVVLSQFGVRDSVWREHAAIVKAIAAGDATQARALAQAHAVEASRTLLQRLPEPAALRTA
jgi:DNA-binding GntR family transcriptional regulator